MTSQSVDALLHSATAARREGRRADAIQFLRQALEIAPGESESWYEYGYMLKADGRYEDALEAYGRALNLGIARPEEVHLNRAVIFSDHLRRDDAAEHELRLALDSAPAYLPGLLNLGNLFEEQGRKEEALSVYARAIAAGGERPVEQYSELRFEALARSSRLAGISDVKNTIEPLKQAASAPVSNVVRANVLFALGQANDRLGAYDEAYESFAKANRWLLRSKGQKYDREHVAKSNRLLKQVFHAPATADSSHRTPEPLFICGMFRSGSTLIEQVLASHPQVAAGGELDFFPRLVTEELAPFPQSMSYGAFERSAKLALDYHAQLLRLFPIATDATYITDKRPDNFMLIGLIKHLFPAARIIHTTRHPVDNCLSIFMQHLNLDVAGYSADLRDIGYYYGEYRHLMEHWKAVYPGTIFDLDYDAFVANPAPRLQELLEFLDLPWNDACLEFHRLGNTVKTASYWQVRQPLNSNASGRWRNYERHLQPLLHELDAAGVSAF